MLGYETLQQNVQIGHLPLQLNTLKDRNQYYDPDKTAENAGVSPASWSLFGHLWPASLVLAAAVQELDIDNKRILELGCGLALPSLVLKQRGADVTASDYHPLSEKFLAENSKLNSIANIPFLPINWGSDNNNSEKFDVIIASDVLYEPGQALLLAQTIKTLMTPTATVMLTCPGRGYRNKFARLMAEQGFQLDEQRVPFNEGEKAPYKGRLMIFTR